MCACHGCELFLLFFEGWHHGCLWQTLVFVIEEALLHDAHCAVLTCGCEGSQVFVCTLCCCVGVLLQDMEHIALGRCEVVPSGGLQSIFAGGCPPLEVVNGGFDFVVGFWWAPF